MWPRIDLSNTVAVCGSAGLASTVLSPWNLKPAGSTSRRTVESSMRATLDDGAGNVPRIPPYDVGGGFTRMGEVFA